ncbi:8679_t:CDS:2 [Ambispora gerdemannii]|uniref:8679_t:CDS:1 n=1 Tax=Ambispora gerdemannii TaxID=144530 RepID=A0A9N9DM49_9GLOM|nr:8679_t:CDS:2 [Ambispora gerdemannii]
MVQLSDVELFEVALLDAFIRNGHLPPNTGNHTTTQVAFNRYFTIKLVENRLIFHIGRAVLNDPKSVQTFLQVFRVVQPFPITQYFEFRLQLDYSERNLSALTQELAMTYHNGDNTGRLEHPSERVYTLDLTQYQPHADVTRIVHAFHERSKSSPGRFQYSKQSTKNAFLEILADTKKFIAEHPVLVIGTTVSLVAVILLPFLFPAGVTALAAPAMYGNVAVSWESLYNDEVAAEEIIATLQSIGAYQS